MKTVIKKRDVLITAAAAVFAEGVLFSILSRQHADHSPSWLLLFHLPGVVLVELTGISDPKAQVVIAFTGAVQLFILFLTGLAIWRQIYRRRDV